MDAFVQRESVPHGQPACHLPLPHLQYSLLAATELTDGVWYPMGGFGTVADALVNICADEGVEVRVSAEVEEITVNGGRATGVRLQGEKQRSVIGIGCDVSSWHGKQRIRYHGPCGPHVHRGRDAALRCGRLQPGPPGRLRVD